MTATPVTDIILYDKSDNLIGVRNKASNIVIHEAIDNISIMEFDLQVKEIRTVPLQVIRANSHWGFSNTNTLTLPFTCVGDLIVVGVTSRNGPITSVTYAGQALTRLINSGTSGLVSEIWGRFTPAGGANSVVINCTGVGIVASVASFANANAIRTTSAVAISNRSTSSTTFVSDVGDMCFDILGGPDTGGGTASANVGQEEILNFAAMSPDVRGASSIEAGTPSVTMGWTHHGEQWAYCAISISPDVGTMEAMQIGTRIGFRYSDDGGESFRGRIGQRSLKFSDAGIGIMHFICAGFAIELQKQPIYDGLVFIDSLASAAIATTLAYTPTWTYNLIGSGFVNLSNRIDTLSVWSALKEIAQQENAMLRQQGNTRVVDFIRTPADCGIILTNTPHGKPNTKLGFIKALVDHVEDDVVNRVVPVGVREGNTVFDLSWCTRNSPYQVKNMITTRPVVTNVVATENVALSSSDAIKLNPIKVIGKNRVLVGFLASESGVIVASFVPEIIVQGAGAIRGSGEFAVTPTNERVNAYMLDNAPEGDILQEIEKCHPDVNGELCDVIMVACMDALMPFAGVGVQKNSGTGTNLFGNTNLIGPEWGTLLLGIAHTDSNRTFASGSGQTRILTLSNTVVDYKYSLGVEDSMNWTVSSSIGFGVLIVAVRLRKAYFIEDGPSIGKYGLSTEMRLDRVSKVPGGRNENYIAGSNTLFDKHVTYLLNRKDPPRTYKFSVAYMPGTPTTWKVGDTIRTVYRSEERNVDETLNIVERTQTFDSANMRHWDVTVSTAPKLPKNWDAYYAEQLEKIVSLESVV